MAESVRGYLSPHACSLRNHACVIPCGGLPEETGPYWTAGQLRPYAKYIVDGSAVDDLFGGFVFNGIRVRENRFIHPSHSVFGGVSDLTDWLMWADALFLQDLNLYALAAVAGETRRDVWVSIPYPHPFQRAFGYIGNRNLDFALDEDRFEAVKWWLIQFLDRWTAHAAVLSPFLELRGFLWQRAAVDAKDGALAARVNEITRQKGYLSLWLTHFGSSGVMEWRQRGFDVVGLNPNYTGNSGYDANWIEIAAIFAAAHQTALQLVWGKGLSYSERHHWDYWNFGLPEKSGYMKESYLIHQFPHQRLDLLQQLSFPDYSRLYTFIKGLYVRTAYPGMTY